MKTEMMTMQERLAGRWLSVKPVAIGLVVGLLAGPVISGMAGFQVRSSTAAAASHAAVIEQQAGFCAERARAELAGNPAGDWQARRTLARRHAAMAGTAVDDDVVQVCADRLAR